MAEKLLLPEAEQLKLGVSLYEAGLFGIAEQPEDYITLKSGRRSPHYFDIRPGVSDVELRDDISCTMANLADAKATQRASRPVEDVYGYYVGTPEAMTSYTAWIAYLAEMPLLQPRVDQNKVSGNKTPLLGVRKSENIEGTRIAAFDDVVTDGQSKIDMIGSLTTQGLIVVDYFVAVDREEGGAPQVLEATGVEITPALAVSSLVAMLHAEDEISQTQYENVVEYIGQYGDPHAQALLNAT